MRLGDLDALKKSILARLDDDEARISEIVEEEIDNAPTVNPSLNLDNITEEDVEKFKMIWQRATSKGLLIISEDRPHGEWIGFGCEPNEDALGDFYDKNPEMMERMKGVFPNGL